MGGPIATKRASVLSSCLPASNKQRRMQRLVFVVNTPLSLFKLPYQLVSVSSHPGHHRERGHEQEPNYIWSAPGAVLGCAKGTEALNVFSKANTFSVFCTLVIFKLVILNVDAHQEVSHKRFENMWESSAACIFLTFLAVKCEWPHMFLKCI